MCAAREPFDAKKFPRFLSALALESLNKIADKVRPEIIILIDDCRHTNEILRINLKRILGFADVVIESHFDGEYGSEAIKKHEGKRVLCFLNGNMPYKDGLAVLKDLDEDSQFKRRIIFTSGDETLLARSQFSEQSPISMGIPFALLELPIFVWDALSRRNKSAPLDTERCANAHDDSFVIAALSGTTTAAATTSQTGGRIESKIISPSMISYMGAIIHLLDNNGFFERYIIADDDYFSINSENIEGKLLKFFCDLKQRHKDNFHKIIEQAIHISALALLSDLEGSTLGICGRFEETKEAMEGPELFDIRNFVQIFEERNKLPFTPPRLRLQNYPGSIDTWDEEGMNPKTSFKGMQEIRRWRSSR